ncbi:hypothetical protein EYF80_068226 [Liparis tanakae]|uniref:Uncharacterized protein n=1 Tax=Liparis tanakae TaxID=230148 RepID=A0A4Z2DYN1_9TELE|nr:hypothetical protein EYF80_068226 [Liparis tanakae]
MAEAIRGGGPEDRNGELEDRAQDEGSLGDWAQVTRHRELESAKRNRELGLQRNTGNWSQRRDTGN